MNTTNYTNAFILVASDYNLKAAKKEAKAGTIAALQLEIALNNPYKYTSDELLTLVYMKRRDMEMDEFEIAKEALFSKPQACLRASPLVKTLGYGVHNNLEGKIAIYPIESDDYKSLLNDTSIAKTHGMRSKKI